MGQEGPNEGSFNPVQEKTGEYRRWSINSQRSLMTGPANRFHSLVT